MLLKEKYVKANIEEPYKFTNVLEVKKVLGYDLTTISGYKSLTEKDKAIAEKLICKFINGFGLEEREKIIPTKITKIVLQGFKLELKDRDFSYLYLNGTVG